MPTFTSTGTSAVIIAAAASRNRTSASAATANLILLGAGGAQGAFLKLPTIVLVMQCRSWGRNILAGDSSRLRAVIRSDISGGFPFNFATVPPALTLMANGIDPMLRWDGQTLQAEVAGVPAPDAMIGQVWLTSWFSNVEANTVTTFSGGTNGAEVINTTYSGTNYDFYAYVRYVDREGNVSDLSPISNFAIAFVPGYSPILPDGYGIGSKQNQYQYQSNLAPIGYTITASGDFTFDFPPGAIVTRMLLTTPSWTAAQYVASYATFNIVLGPLGQPGATMALQTTYIGVPLPDGPWAGKVVRRQILRNTAGQATTFYVDIDTPNLGTTLFVSNNADTDLLGNEAVPLFDDVGAPLANTHGFPPSWKSAIVSHLGRVFAAVDGVYDEGHVIVTAGSTQVQGVATSWPVTMVGRALYVVGAHQPYLIDAVDPVAQILTLDAPYTEPSSIFAFYAIRPPAAEWRRIYYTPAGEPESWPPFYALDLQEDGDEITGLMSLSSFLYILERKHIYRFTFKSDPAKDGAVFLSSQRGALNQRCWVQAEDTAYMLDEQGIHSFSGGISRPISEPIQDLFRDDSPSPLRVNWDADTRYWHAAYSEVHGTVRFFVAMTGSKYPRHAICYSYRQDRWWLEEYHRPICSSTRANVGIARVFCGIDHRELLALNVGWTDGLTAAGGTVRGLVGASTAVSLTDPLANFTPDATNLALFLVSGLGKGQWRRVVVVSPTRLDVLTPWLITPRPGDQYIVGGIDYQWRSGWFRFTDDIEADSTRDVEMVFQPVTQGALDLQLFYNHVEEPRPWSRNADGSVLLTAGDPVGIVDLTQKNGRAIQRMEGHLETYATGDRYVSPELSGVQVAEPVRIFRVTLNGVEGVG